MARIRAAWGEEKKSAQRPPLDDAEVARVAYALYEQRDRADGHDLDDWLQAEGMVRSRARDGRR